MKLFVTSSLNLFAIVRAPEWHVFDKLWSFLQISVASVCMFIIKTAYRKIAELEAGNLPVQHTKLPTN